MAATAPGDREDYWFLNSWATIRRPSAAGPDGVSIIEHHLPCGDSPPLHVHHQEDEVFHILDGRVRFRVGEVERVAGPGETLVATRGVPHSFRVESDAGARFLTLNIGCGFEKLVRSFGRPATACDLPPPEKLTPERIATLRSEAMRHGIDIVGPPLHRA